MGQTVSVQVPTAKQLSKVTSDGLITRQDLYSLKDALRDVALAKGVAPRRDFGPLARSDDRKRSLLREGRCARLVEAGGVGA
jgi:hypothetical protein